MNLKKARYQLGLSLRDVSRATGLCYSTIGKAENHKHDAGYSKILKLQKFYATELAKINKEELINDEN